MDRFKRNFAQSWMIYADLLPFQLYSPFKDGNRLNDVEMEDKLVPRVE